MPTWKSPLSAASLPSSTRSYDVPACWCSCTTAAISRATSAGPSRAGSASTCTAAPQPRASALRSWSTASGGPTVSTVTRPPVASASRIASSTAHSSCGLTVKPTCRPSTACASSVSRIWLEESGTRLMQTSTCRPAPGVSVTSRPLDALVARVEQRGGVGGADRHGVQLLHVGDREPVAHDRLVRWQVGHQHVLAQGRRRAGAGDVRVVAVAVGQRGTVPGQDRLAAEHVAPGAARRGVVVDGHRAEHRLGLLLTLLDVGLTSDEVGHLDLRPLHARL